MALTSTPPPELGRPCPDFTLPSVTGGTWSAKKDWPSEHGLLVMFICNHCPYVQAIEERLIQLALDLREIKVTTLGICSNDAHNYPDDSFANLKKRALEKKYPFPYLHDEEQSVARTFGAVCTPDFFMYDKDRRLFYRGRLDDSWKDPKQVTKRELYLAARDMMQGKAAPSLQTSSMGCNIKWASQ
jgi:thiol-disulfide isomerase/thioredoxin